jgi:hypothetical protein
MTPPHLIRAELLCKAGWSMQPPGSSMQLPGLFSHPDCHRQMLTLEQAEQVQKTWDVMTTPETPEKLPSEPLASPPPYQVVYLPCSACGGINVPRLSACKLCGDSGQFASVVCGTCKGVLNRPAPHDCPRCGGTPVQIIEGWNCGNCKSFNGSAKEWLMQCRACGQSGPSKPKPTSKESDAPIFTYADLKNGLENIRYDIGCRRCANIFFTGGSDAPSHSDNCNTFPSHRI